MSLGGLKDESEIQKLFTTILDGLNNPKKSSKTKTKRGGKQKRKTKEYTQIPVTLYPGTRAMTPS